MKNSPKNFIPIICFLFFGLLFLWSAFPSVKNDLLNKKDYILEEWDISNHTFTGETDCGRTFVLAHSAFILEYSLDGGDSFFDAPNNEICLSELKMNNLIQYPTSVRWEPPIGSFNPLISFVYRIRDDKRKRRSQSIVYTDVLSVSSTLPIIHISVSEKDIFDWEEGIMNLGVHSMNDSTFYKKWWYRPANYNERGSQSGRKAYFHLYQDGKQVIANDVMMKVGGNATRSFPQKTLKIYPLERNGKRGRVNFRLFGKKGSKKSESFLLRQSGNDNYRTLFADLLMHRLADSTNVVVMNGYPTTVYLNGNYWGIYNLRERIDQHMLGSIEDAKDKNITILFCEGSGNEVKLKKGKKKEQAAFEAVLASLPDDGLTNNDVERLSDEVSLKSFSDYIIFETFFGNQDWLHNNVTWYREKGKKWKWILNDLDYSLAYTGASNVESNLFPSLVGEGSVTGIFFNKLISNERFKKRFKKRVDEILEFQLSEERIQFLFNDLKNEFSPEIENQIRRWRTINSIEEWEEACQANLTFLIERRTNYRKQVEDL